MSKYKIYQPHDDRSNKIVVSSDFRNKVNVLGTNPGDTILQLKSFIVENSQLFFDSNKPSNTQQVKVLNEEDLAELQDNLVITEELHVDVIKTFIKIDNQPLLNKLAQNRFNLPANWLNTFSQLLRNTQSILAGGSVLAAYANYYINDFDIYVNASNADQLINGLRTLNLETKFVVFAPPYDESFFRKNNITSLVRMSVHNGHYYEHAVDVMIIPDHIQLTDVVSNFDLTFCQIWFDGEDVYCTDWEHIRNRHGKLNDDYMDSFINGNTFIKNRIDKYRTRGFQIDYNCNGTGTLQVLESKRLVSDEDWVVRKLYENLLIFMANSMTYERYPTRQAAAAANVRRDDYSTFLKVQYHIEYMMTNYSLQNFKDILQRVIDEHPERLGLFMINIGSNDFDRLFKHIAIELLYSYINTQWQSQYPDKIRDVLNIDLQNEQLVTAQNENIFPIHYTSFEILSLIRYV